MFAPRLSWVSSFQATSLLRFNLQSSFKSFPPFPRAPIPFQNFSIFKGMKTEGEKEKIRCSRYRHARTSPRKSFLRGHIRLGVAHIPPRVERMFSVLPLGTAFSILPPPPTSGNPFLTHDCPAKAGQESATAGGRSSAHLHCVRRPNRAQPSTPLPRSRCLSELPPSPFASGIIFPFTLSC